MNSKNSAILMAIVVCGLTAALYAALLGGMYQFGFWGIDLFTMILAEFAIIGGVAGIAGYSEVSTQSIARWSVVRQAGIVLALLTIVHTIACIASPTDIDTVYYVVLGVVVVWFVVRMFFSHTGSSMQEQVESQQNTLSSQQKAIANSLHVPTMMLVGAIQACDAPQADKLAAEDSVKSVSTTVDGLSLKRVNGNAILMGEIGKWSVRLAKMKDSLAGDNAAAELNNIAIEARNEIETINNLYLQ